MKNLVLLKQEYNARVEKPLRYINAFRSKTFWGTDETLQIFKRLLKKYYPKTYGENSEYFWFHASDQELDDSEKEVSGTRYRVIPLEGFDNIVDEPIFVSLVGKEENLSNLFEG